MLSYAFRPFFLASALYTSIAMLVWMLMLSDKLRLATRFSRVDWHGHEMLYGYLAGVLAGYLLTTTPRWTQRPPIHGYPLLILLLVWLAGRIVIVLPMTFGWLEIAAIDVSFLILVALATAREIIAGENWQNLKNVFIVGLFIAANIVFHLEAHIYGAADYGHRLAVSAAILLIMVMAGRIVPRYTRNWLVRENLGRLPIAFDRFDLVSIIVGMIALAAWVIAPRATISGGTLICAAVLQAFRLARWAGDRTLRNRLVLILHVGYFFIPLGFLLSGWAALTPEHIALSAGTHAWTAGAIGTMTLAMITRTSLRHTSRDLVADPLTQLIFLAAVLGGLLRVVSAFLSQWGQELIWISAVCWIMAFLGFAIVYGPILCRPSAVRIKERDV